jgi:putative salt-induced outer membrane protein
MKKALCVLALLCPVAAAFAETPAPPPLWSGKGEISFVSTSGNTDVQTLGAGLEVHYKPLPWSADAKASFVRSETSGQVNARSLAGMLRGARSLTPRLDVFVQGDYLKDTFAGIDRRLSGSGGVAYGLLKTDRQSLQARVGVGYTKEDRVQGADRSFASGLAGLGWTYKLTPTTDLTEDFGFTADLKESSDWRIANVFAVNVAINKTFSLKASHELQYLRQPVEGFGRTDTITKAALVAQF